MNFKKIMKNCSFKVQLQNTEKNAIIEEVIDMLVADGQIEDRDATLKAVMERENKMSTGMQNGIAIPHGKTDAVKKLVVGVALSKDGVDFASMDGQPSRIFVITVSPTTNSGPHITFLSEISKRLNKPSVRENLIYSETEEKMRQILLA